MNNESTELFYNKLKLLLNETFVNMKIDSWHEFKVLFKKNDDGSMSVSNLYIIASLANEVERIKNDRA